MYMPPDLTALKDEVEERLREEREAYDDQLRRHREEGLGVAMEY
jgi:histone deacetylase HOS2